MAQCEWAILCDYAFQDIGRKNCLIGIFDRIIAARVPTTHHQAALVVRLLGEHRERAQVRLAITRPTGETLIEVNGQGDLGDTGSSDLILNIRGLQLPDFGIYGVNVFVNDALTKTITFTVTRPPQPPPTQPQPPQQ